MKMCCLFIHDEETKIICTHILHFDNWKLYLRKQAT